MSFNGIVFVAIGLAAVQMLVAWLITNANKEYFRRPASHYGQAIKELGRHKPWAARIIRIRYGLLLVELLAVALLK
jgi:hypothetical protein